MIALTQEKREELVSRLKIYIRTTETAIKAGLDTEEDLFNLEVRKIALAALTAEKRATVDVVGVIWNEWKPDVGAFLFTAPPVPEIKLPEKLNAGEIHYELTEKYGMDVSIDLLERGLAEEVYSIAVNTFERLNGLGD